MYFSYPLAIGISFLNIYAGIAVYLGLCHDTFRHRSSALLDITVLGTRYTITERGNGLHKRQRTSGSGASNS